MNTLFEFDKKKSQTNGLIIGTDEAGRGPGAGPVCAAAVYFPNIDKKFIDLFNVLPITALIENRILCMHGGLAYGLKKVEELKRLQKEEERLQKEKEKQDKLRDLQLKQITVDANGNVIQIRPLTYEQLITEFTTAGSNQREIEKIKGEEPAYSKNKISINKSIKPLNIPIKDEVTINSLKFNGLANKGKVL